MKFRLKKVSGEFEVEGDLKEIIKQVSLLEAIPDKCPLCGGELGFQYRKPQGYDYYGLRCKSCGAVKNFGQAKEDNSLFWKWDKGFEKYKRTEEAEETQDTDLATPAQLAYLEKIYGDRLETICASSYGRSPAQLTKSEASELIEEQVTKEFQR